MKGTTFDKSTNSYKAQIRYDGTIVNLGKYHTRKEASDRYREANKAVDEGKELMDWLEKNRNKKRFENAYFSDDFDSESSEETENKDGYHSGYGFCYNRMKWLQEKYKEELEGKTHIVKEVLWFDFSGDLFRKKLVNFKYWKSYTAKIGKQITMCNPEITAWKLKNSLLKVMQQNIYIPKNNMNNFQGFWGDVAEQLEEIVKESIYEIPERKFKKANKIIYNPDVNLTKEQRQEISRQQGAKTKTTKTLNKLMKFYKEGMSKKGLAREAKANIKTVCRYWDEVILKAA